MNLMNTDRMIDCTPNDTMQESDFMFWVNPVVRFIYLNQERCEWLTCISDDQGEAQVNE
jgi:hypothetical protein